MSDQITNAFVRQFRDDFIHLVQQKGSRLRPTVRDDGELRGNMAYFDRIGSVEMSKVTGRHTDTPLTNTPHSRRRCILDDYDVADLIDRQDRIRLLLDPTSAYSRNFLWAAGRKMDDVIISALLGNSYSVDDDLAASAVALPSSQKILHGSAALTKPKILQAREILRSSDVDEDEPLYAAIGAQQVTNLLGIDEVVSADYSVKKALIDGKPAMFMGFMWVPINRLPKSGTTRSCVFYAGTGAGLAIGEEVMIDIGPRRDKRLATQVYAAMSLGATRTEEEKVVEVQCTES